MSRLLTSTLRNHGSLISRFQVQWTYTTDAPLTISSIMYLQLIPALPVAHLHSDLLQTLDGIFSIAHKYSSRLALIASNIIIRLKYWLFLNLKCLKGSRAL